MQRLTEEFETLAEAWEFSDENNGTVPFQLKRHDDPIDEFDDHFWYVTFYAEAAYVAV